MQKSTQSRDSVFEQIFELAPCGMLLIDQQNTVVVASHSLEAMFGHHKGSLKGQSFHTLFAERSRAEIKRHVQLATEEGQRLRVGQTDLLYGYRGQRKEFCIEVDLTPLAHNSEALLLMTIHDRSEQKRLDAVMNQMLTELRRSNGELQQFAYVASHDLQTPLRHITSFIELLSKKLKLDQDDEAQRWLSFITNATVTMRALIDDLLVYSRVRAHDQGLERVDFAELWKLVENSARQERPDCILEAHDLPVVTGLSNQLLQVLHNLVQNSLKFARSDVPLRIDLLHTEKNGFHRFELRDNGIGIAAEHYDRVFQLFQKLHAKETYPGTGIGLAICKKVVEIHGGTIWIDSKVGSGTSFFFTLRSDDGVSKYQDGIDSPGGR